MREDQFPETWASSRIEELLTINSNGKPFQQGWSPQCESQPANEDEWGVLKTTAIQNGEFWGFENKKLPINVEPRPHLEIRAGDLLMTCAGPRNRCGVVCYVKETRPKLLMSGKMYRFVPDNRVLNEKYLEAYISSHDAQRVIDSMKTGINDSGLNLTHGRFAELVVPVAPPNEQKRIVAKIEELFSELDNGVIVLETAREQLKVYRQAVLKQAFEGKLTAKWREDNADKLEKPDNLLARIKKEREARYKEQLDEWNAAIEEWELLDKEGKSPPRPKNPKSVAGCPKTNCLPKEWDVVPLEALISFGPTNGWSPKAINGVTSTKAITLTATTSGQFDGSQFKYIDAKIPKHSSLWLKTDDILVQRGNTIEYVGVPALYPGEDNQYIYPDLIMKIQAAPSISAQYLVYAMSMSSSRTFLRERAVGAAGSMPKINQGTLSSLPIPVCSEIEQKKIVELLEERLSFADSCIEDIDLQLEKAEILRQSILKKAFSGELVPQDPNDEPASELLARIKAEKKAEQLKKTKKKPASKNGRRSKSKESA